MRLNEYMDLLINRFRNLWWLCKKKQSFKERGASRRNWETYLQEFVEIEEEHMLCHEPRSMQTVIDEEHLVEVPRWVVHCKHGVQDIGDGHGAGIQEFVEQGPVFVTEPPQVVEEEMRLAFPYIVVIDHPLQHPLSAHASVHRSSTKCIFVGKLHKIKPPSPNSITKLALYTPSHWEAPRT